MALHVCLECDFAFGGVGKYSFGYDGREKKGVDSDELDDGGC